ncbi:DUF4124 domain-containing protein [Pseudomonas akapageensis]|uniref:DUF4124 domain-containing protein n=1 Tax=Pseudomonas akapageensis TaxID=2609961 RepID=UPI001409421A|nr:DUF4124 domain-containing protein [Pseudomonas akapageensis]
MRSVLIVVLGLLALPAAAQVYKYTDANGNTTYSDQPAAGASNEPIELPPLNSVAPPPLVSAQQPTSKPIPPKAKTFYTVLRVGNMVDQQAIRANDGNLIVEVLVRPRLQPEHRLQLLLDGQAYGQPSNVPSLQLVNLDRGEHNLAIQVLSDQTVVQQSQPIAFTVLRTHLRPTQ